MLDTFNATLSPMLVMFLCIIIGFVLSKKKLISDDAATVLSKLEYYVFSPALTINSFSKNCTVASISKEYVLILYCVLIGVIAIAISYPLSRLFVKDGYKKRVFEYAIAFGNFGYMGQPVILAIFGDEMLYKYMLFTLPLSILVSTWGISTLIPTKHTKAKLHFVKNIFKFPVIAMLIGVILGLFNVRQYFPEFLTTTISNLGACMGPVAMLLLGVVVGGYNFKKLLSDQRVYIVSFLRLLIIPSVFVVLLWLIGAEREVLTLCLFAFATPLGLNTVVYPASSGNDTSTGASMAMISHTLSIVTIPIIYSIFSAIFN